MKRSTFLDNWLRQATQPPSVHTPKRKRVTPRTDPNSPSLRWTKPTPVDTPDIPALDLDAPVTGVALPPPQTPQPQPQPVPAAASSVAAIAPAIAPAITAAGSQTRVRVRVEADGSTEVETTPFAFVGQCTHPDGCSHQMATECDEEEGEEVAAQTVASESVDGNDCDDPDVNTSLPDLPQLPLTIKGRKIGKYISKGTKRNGFLSTVVYFNGKISHPVCHAGVCTKYPTFGFPGDNRPSKCSKCAMSGMVDVANPKCPCGKVMNFGLPGARPSACGKCVKPGMINLTGHRCPCGTRPTFGFLGDKRPSACSKCIKPGMVDISNPKCPCGKAMNFGFPDDARASACLQCAQYGMVDITHVTCLCGTRMSFGFADDVRPSACVKCAKPGMVNIVTPKCPCGTQMVFGFPCDARPSACSKCAKPGMIDVVNNKCAAIDCTTTATFPNKTGIERMFCAKHAFEAGVTSSYNARASKAACVSMDALAVEGHVFEHEHLNKTSMPWTWEGKEVEGLVAPRKHRPDGVCRDAAGKVVDVFFYHGNLYHGYPPEHELYDTEVTLPAGHVNNTKERYWFTMAAMQLFVDSGYRVYYLWEHHHTIARRGKLALWPMCIHLTP